MRAALVTTVLGLAPACDRVFAVPPPDAYEAPCIVDTFDGELDRARWKITDPDNTPISITVREGQLAISLAPETGDMYIANSVQLPADRARGLRAPAMIPDDDGF